MTLLLMFIVPLVILITSYLMTFRSIAYSEKNLFPSDSIVIRTGAEQGTIEQVGQLVKASYRNRQKLLQRAKYKSLRMSVLIILAFIICWTPYYIMMILVIFTNLDEKVSNPLKTKLKIR